MNLPSQLPPLARGVYYPLPWTNQNGWPIAIAIAAARPGESYGRTVEWHAVGPAQQPQVQHLINAMWDRLDEVDPVTYTPILHLASGGD